MIEVTIDSIKALNPCKDGIDNFEIKYPKFNGSLVKLLKLEDVPYNDKIWLASRLVDYKILQKWSVSCAESVVDNYNEQYPNDSRISDCIKMTIKYINGDASLEELSAARSSAAWSAWSARSAESAESAAESAAWSAESAAWSAWSVESAESAARSVESARSVEKQQEDINLILLIDLLEGNHGN